MSPEQQRIVIAEACGYRNIVLREDPDEGFDPLLTGFKNDNHFDEQIPDYLNSLNAMHKVEKIIRSKPNKRNGQVYSYIYESELSELTGGEPVYATAAQRAEAFLKTIGKWID